MTGSWQVLTRQSSQPAMGKKLDTICGANSKQTINGLINWMCGKNWMQPVARCKQTNVCHHSCTVVMHNTVLLVCRTCVNGTKDKVTFQVPATCFKGAGAWCHLRVRTIDGSNGLNKYCFYPTTFLSEQRVLQWLG